MQIMRIHQDSEKILFWLATILCTTLVAAGDQTLNFNSNQSSLQRDIMPIAGPSRKGKLRNIQRMIRLESGKNNLSVECCPTIEEMVEPIGGRNKEGMYLQLYTGGENKQRFYEYSCKPEVLNKPCKYLDRRIRAQSRCVQKIIYTYAIVMKPSKDQKLPLNDTELLQSNSDLSLDYIAVRRGCSCEIQPKPKKRKIAETVRPIET